MDLILISNEPGLARAADEAGIERVMIDLEHRGKESRQRATGFFLSDHTLDDVAAVRDNLEQARVQVRIDAWHAGSSQQIDDVIACGADVIMLAMTEHADLVRRFVDAVDGRATVSILVETASGIGNLGELLAVGGIDEVHIGLNDLMLSTGGRVIFEPVADGRLDTPARRVRDAGLGLGVGGMTAPDVRGLPVDPGVLLGEQVRLGTTMGWLGRSFRHGLVGPDGAVDTELLGDRVGSIRQALDDWAGAGADAMAANRATLKSHVDAWMKTTRDTG